MAGSERLDYGHLMQLSMRRMMADVLSHVAKHGLPGEHHFFITFETNHPGVDIPAWLRDSYPSEMTIVLQEWFADLAVTSDRFSVTLNFSDRPEALVIPLQAVKTFVDPSVKFGLKFDGQEPDEDGEDVSFEDPKETEDGPEDTPDPPRGSADVVSLDRFRKS